MTDVRRELHRFPEVSWEEHRTTATIRDRALSLTLSERAIPTATGAMFVLDGGRPGRTVLLRADIDALPINERGPVASISAVPGVMHACGHDAHAAALLGAAGALSDVAESLPGRYVFLFQPAEERVSGARVLLDAGLLDGEGVEAVVGLHVTSLAPVGLVASRPGVLMAASDAIRIVVTSPGGHGAIEPERGNAVLAAARVAERLGLVVAGLAAEGTNCVCSAGMLHAGTAPNVMPEHAELFATLRTFDADQRATALGRLSGLVDDIASDLGVVMTVSLPDGCRPVVNDPDATRLVLGALRGALPGSTVFETQAPVPASDDVSELLHRVSGCYFFVGAALADGSSGPHHSPTFRLDETVLPIAARALVASAVTLAAA